MGKRELHIGPGAASLLLVAVVVSMGVLGLLSLSSVRTDIRLTERSTTLVTDQYAASAQAERDLAALDAALASGGELPEGMERDGDIVRWQVACGDIVLRCSVQIGEQGSSQYTWKEHSLHSKLADSEENFDMFEETVW